MNAEVLRRGTGASVLAQNNRFGRAWLQPTAIMPARFAKLSMQLDF